MTRAKRNLYIHCNTDLFTEKEKTKAIFNNDTEPYPDPDEITLQPMLKDVYLDFFKPHKDVILKLVSGDSLIFDKGFLWTTDGERIASLSMSYRKQLDEWYAKGFEVVSASVAYIIAWKGKDEPEDAEETAVMLPELVLRQRKE